jgi:hypothetical protein
MCKLEGSIFGFSCRGKSLHISRWGEFTRRANRVGDGGVGRGAGSRGWNKKAEYSLSVTPAKKAVLLDAIGCNAFYWINAEVHWQSPLLSLPKLHDWEGFEALWPFCESASALAGSEAGVGEQKGSQNARRLVGRARRGKFDKASLGRHREPCTTFSGLPHWLRKSCRPRMAGWSTWGFRLELSSFPSYSADVRLHKKQMENRSRSMLDSCWSWWEVLVTQVDMQDEAQIEHMVTLLLRNLAGLIMLWIVLMSSASNPIVWRWDVKGWGWLKWWSRSRRNQRVQQIECKTIRFRYSHQLSWRLAFF